MIGVAITAVVITGERWLFDNAARIVTEEAHRPYFLDEALGVWLVLNIPLPPLVWLSCLVFRRRSSA